MIWISIFGGVVFLVTLCILSTYINQKWLHFKDLEIGDICGAFHHEMQTERITNIETDSNGYTIKIYTENNTYTFFDYLIGKIVLSND